MPAPTILMGPSSISRAARLVRKGGLIVYPTDTVYGLGCDPTSQRAVGRLFEAKGRGPKPVSVLCSSMEKAGEIVTLEGRAAELARTNWPGPLTIVAPMKRALPSQLTQGAPKLGVRVPGHAGCRELVSKCGGWLTGTSANISGMPSARTAGEAFAQLGGVVDIILDGGELKGRESTVVEAVGHKVAILRTGPIGVGKGMTGRRTS